jgi:hypothetical protein
MAKQRSLNDESSEDLGVKRPEKNHSTRNIAANKIK